MKSVEGFTAYLCSFKPLRAHYVGHSKMKTTDGSDPSGSSEFLLTRAKSSDTLMIFIPAMGQGFLILSVSGFLHCQFFSGSVLSHVKLIPCVTFPPFERPSIRIVCFSRQTLRHVTNGGPYLWNTLFLKELYWWINPELSLNNDCKQGSRSPNRTSVKWSWSSTWWCHRR